ncbi:MAG: ABC transporter ATP-binding protein [Alphaproteobacteria bacterium]|nr:ABC transporter ATP-binding protein [Alphaproteobacteria bacterium]
MAHIEFDAISKSFGSKSFGATRVLDRCSLAVEKGRVMTLLGPSGCGKTTLLRTLAGFVAPDAGTVRLGGVDITDLPANRRQVGFVFQNYALFPHLTVAGNVAYGLKVRRTSRHETAERVARALDLVGLTAQADRWPAQLSGGQQQRVAIARALVLEPAVLLLDEPFNALDAKLRLAMQVELRKLIARVGITSIFVTHDQTEAMTLSDDVAVMQGGRIEQVGPPLAIYDRPATAFVAGFIGRANLLPVRVAGGRVAEVPALAATTGDGARILVVRPENLAIAGPGAAGWQGRVVFASALGPTTEIEVDIGAAEPLRVAATRRAGEALPPLGQAVGVQVVDPAGALLLAPGDAHDR